MLVALFATVVWGQNPTNPQYVYTVTSGTPNNNPYVAAVLYSPFTDLPQCIKNWVSNNMKNYTIVQAQKVEQRTNGQKLIVTYEVKVSPIVSNIIKAKQVGAVPQWLQFDTYCTFAKNISAPTPMPALWKVYQFACQEGLIFQLSLVYSPDH